jgi:trk system potassium uptake protein TrkH
VRDQAAVREVIEAQTLSDMRRFVSFVIVATIVIELLGALAMFSMWHDPEDGPLSFGERAGMSAFHSISAFCNAGFDLTGESLVPYRASVMPLLVIAPLIVLGGLGFGVIRELVALPARWLTPRSRRRITPVLSLHAKLALITTLGVLTCASASIALAQAAGSVHPPGNVIADSAFWAVTARTAGFNAAPMEELAPASQLVLIGVMLVGGSPGSMAGGFKTVTLAILVLAVLATVRGRAETEVFGRTIPEPIVRRASAIALSLLALPMVAAFALCITDPGDPFARLFEAVSAATTTGLSLGGTGDLSPAGKFVLIIAMFLGRVGPLAFIGALVFRKLPSRSWQYPRENVTLG